MLSKINIRFCTTQLHNNFLPAGQTDALRVTKDVPREKNQNASISSIDPLYQN